MQIVIDIPEETYKGIMLGKWNDNGLAFYVKDGTPLPKGHGRLIDVNDLLDDICLEDNEYNRDCNVGEIITLENIDKIPIIIEADKGEEK